MIYVQSNLLPDKVNISMCLTRYFAGMPQYRNAVKTNSAVHGYGKQREKLTGCPAYAWPAIPNV